MHDLVIQIKKERAAGRRDPRAAMIPDLQELLRQLEAIKAEGHALCAGLTESQFNNVAVTRTLPAFDRAIEVGRGKGLSAEGPFRRGSGWLCQHPVKSDTRLELQPYCGPGRLTLKASRPPPLPTS